MFGTTSYRKFERLFGSQPIVNNQIQEETAKVVADIVYNFEEETTKITRRENEDESEIHNS
jgi:prephenate dehydrogenase